MEKTKADLVVISCEIKASLPFVMDSIKGLRAKFGYNLKIIVRGAAIDKNSAYRIGADLYCKDVLKIVDDCQALIKEQTIMKLIYLLKQKVIHSSF